MEILFRSSASILPDEYGVPYKSHRIPEISFDKLEYQNVALRRVCCNWN